MKSITRAAEALHLSQPAVSIQLKNLQDQFEIPLTEVIGRKLYITAFGKELAKSSDKIIAEVGALKHKVNAYKGFLSGQITFSVASTAKYVMPYFITDFISQHMGVDLQIDVTNKTRVIRSLESNEVDFAMVSVLPEKIAVEKISLLPNKLYLVGNKKMTDDNVALSKAQLEKLPLIFREEGSATRQAMENFIEEENLTVQKSLQLTSNEAVKQAIIAGIGYSIMPIIGIKNELLNGELHIIPVVNLPIETEWNLIWLKNKKFSPVAENFVKYLRENKNDIASTKFSWYNSF